MNKFICSKCGTDINLENDKYGYSLDRCHEIRLGRVGYGSIFDGCDLNFNLCDDCLYKFIQSFTEKGKNKVMQSGCWQEYKPDNTVAEQLRDFIGKIKGNKYYIFGRNKK